jgi:hypothetical protein
MDRYSDLQLLLYAIGSKTLGCKIAKILILIPNNNIVNTPIDIDYITERVSELIENLV